MDSSLATDAQVLLKLLTASTCPAGKLNEANNVMEMLGQNEILVYAYGMLNFEA